MKFSQGLTPGIHPTNGVPRNQLSESSFTFGRDALNLKIPFFCRPCGHVVRASLSRLTPFEKSNFDMSISSTVNGLAVFQPPFV